MSDPKEMLMLSREAIEDASGTLRLANELSGAIDLEEAAVPSPWQPLTAPGQIQQGDWLCFTVSGRFICAQARLLIDAGTDREEVVYNRKNNHYFCTDMAIDGTSNHKNVLVAPPNWSSSHEEHT